MGQYDKYYLYKKQRAVSGTSNWEDVITADGLVYSYDGDGTMPPIMAEQNSEDCGYQPTIEPIYRWIDLNPNVDYYCEDCEEPTPPTPSGETLYSWSATTDYICSGTTKYQKKLEIQSTDSGQTWTLVSPPVSGVGSIIELCAVDCGCSSPQTSQKLTARYSYSATYSAACDSSSVLTSGDTRPFWYQYPCMTSAVIGDCISVIGDYAFYQELNDCGLCTGTELSAVTLPNTITSIGDWSFAYCCKLTNISIPSSVNSIGDGAFYECQSLPYIVIPNGVTKISASAFTNCTSLTSVIIPNSVTSIGDRAFEFCHSLTSVTIPSSVISIYQFAFYQCDSLREITIPDSVRILDIQAFMYCYALTSCTIGNGVTSISDGAFQECTSLTDITIGSGVTSIGEEAFARCSGLTSITIPNSVTSIDSLAFADCTSLTDVTIGNGVTSIGGGAFVRCSGLTSVTIKAKTPPTVSNSTFNYTNNCPINVPAASVNAYKNASGWSTYASRIYGI